MKFCFLALILSISAFANLDLAPKNFDQNVFVDFKNVKYKIVFNASEETMMVKTTINFSQLSKGYPLFKSNNEILSAKIGDEIVEIGSVKAPSASSKFKFVKKVLQAGDYELVITSKNIENIRFAESKKSVRAALWMSDLSSESFMYKYMPSNLEYDQFAVEIETIVENMEREHTLMTNGETTVLGKNHFISKYPDFYTTSSLYYHLFEKDAYPTVSYYLTSIDKRKIKVTIYTNEKIEKFKKSTDKIFDELEKDYGAWPYDFLIVYGAGSGGMEYAGATRTSFRALGHEMHHCYFARGIMPSSGNAGWVDEALASWRDNDYAQASTFQLSRTQMASRSIYDTTTDRNAYTKGRNFIAYLDRLVEDKGGMKKFLKVYAEDNMYKSSTTLSFKNQLEVYFNKDFTDLFKKYIYSGKTPFKALEHKADNPFHSILTKQQQLDLL